MTQNMLEALGFANSIYGSLVDQSAMRKQGVGGLENVFPILSRPEQKTYWKESMKDSPSALSFRKFKFGLLSEIEKDKIATAASAVATEGTPPAEGLPTATQRVLTAPPSNKDFRATLKAGESNTTPTLNRRQTNLQGKHNALVDLSNKTDEEGNKKFFNEGKTVKQIKQEAKFAGANPREAVKTYNEEQIAQGNSPATGTGGSITNMSQGMQGALSGAGSALGGLSAGNMDEGDLAVREGIRGAIGKMGPWGAIISAASGVVDAVGDMTGLNLDTIDPNSAKRAGVGGAATFNKMMNMLPGNSMIYGSIAALTGGKTAEAQMSEQTQQLGGAFGGTVNDIAAAQDLGGKSMLFGRKKANAFIRDANEKNRQLTSMKDENDRRLQNTAGADLANQNFNRYLGNTMQNTMRVGKSGMKFPHLDEVRLIINNFQSEVVQKFADGGKMNVIVEGALHSRKNNLQDLEDLEDVTKKGIPVITYEEGGEVVQVAEVEDGELVLIKEITDKLEVLYEDGSEEAMIEAGKILAEELMTNTDDRTDKLLTDEDKD